MTNLMQSTGALTSKRPTTSEEFAYHEVRTEILTGRIPAGTRIIQSEIAAKLGVSVTPVREAMRRLQSEGLVNLTPHRGATVGELELSKAREIYQLRILLEPMSVERAVPHFTSENVQELESLCVQMDAADNVSEFAALNQRFHEKLLDLDNGWLSRIIQMLRMASSPYVALSLHANPKMMAESNAEHRKMLRAFAEADIAAAREITVHHLSGTMVTLEEHLRDSRREV